VAGRDFGRDHSRCFGSGFANDVLTQAALGRGAC